MRIARMIVLAGVLAGVSCRKAATDEISTPGPLAAELEAAARDVIAFLRGDSPALRVALADTVLLHVSPDGGGGRTEIPRAQLARPTDWIAASGGRRYPLAPPAGLTKVTTRVGRHLNCREYSLASRVPGLARLPHVGVMLQPEGGGSCLQTWNVTLVFDSTSRAPRLVAAVYDQWEW